MVIKALKWTVIGATGLTLAGGAIFGTDLGSYIHTGAHALRTSVKDSVPIEFEIARARDMLNDVLPEMQANVRLIAQQEVEISNLGQDIADSGKTLSEQAVRLAKLRNSLDTQSAFFTFSGVTFSREQVKDDLNRKFESYKEAELVLAGKKKLLENRQHALAAAVQAMDKARSQKLQLESRIASLEAQFRLVQAAASTSKLDINNTKLAQTERVIAQVKKQLDVAERVLASESRFTDAIAVDGIDEKELVQAVDDHFNTPRVATADAGPAAKVEAQ
jgi:hypothetical protein